MINRIKNIINLTKIFFQNSFQTPYLIDKKNHKLNKKSVFLWCIIIFMIAISYLSYSIVKELVVINQQTLFINFVLLILLLLLFLQVIMSCVNVYYFSKDLELILPLPIKPVDILISKFNTITINTYFMELIFVLSPLIIYGIFISAGLLYYIYVALLLIIFPVLPALIISTIMMFFMKLSRFIKNKDIFQIIITFIFCAVFIFIVFNLVKGVLMPTKEETVTDATQLINRLNEFNKSINNLNNYFLEINPSINVLNNWNKVSSIINFLKIVFIDFIFFIVFIFIGKITYLKDILKNNTFNNAKKIKRINLNKKCKSKNKMSSYINKEFKMLFKNSAFFIQCIYPSIILIVTLLIMVFKMLPSLGDLISYEQVNIKTICIISIVFQFLLTFSSISITSISREGKNAIFMKFMPIDFYKQIFCKSMPQIIVNLFFILILEIIIYRICPNVNFIYYLYIFIIANLLNIINSLLMVVVDIKDPFLNWNTENELISKNNKKLLQYVLTIIIILLLVYFQDIFSDLNIHLSCGIIILILLIILIILNIIINKNKNKLFKKIE